MIKKNIGGINLKETFKLAEGVSVVSLEGIHQCYEICENNIIANISIENMASLLKSICKELKAPLFFFIELPCDEEVENQLKIDGDNCFHRDVYYLDNCTIEVILAIIKRYGDLLINDGLVQFGFASHEDEDEIYITKYKLLNIYSKNINKYALILDNFKVPKEATIKTVWDNFSSETAGTVSIIEVEGETIYDIVYNLSDEGLYFSERVNEK